MFRLILVAAALLAAFPGVSAAWDDAPFTMKVSTVGRFQEGSSWHLNVNSAGKAELTIDAPTGKIRRQFKVSNDQMAALRRAVAQAEFFELADEYGEEVPDGSTRTVTVTAGDRTKSVKVRYLMNWVQNDRDKLREPSRAVGLLVLVRGWFADADAVDLREYDRKVLEAVR
jgi:hypothetical protein